MLQGHHHRLSPTEKAFTVVEAKSLHHKLVCMYRLRPQASTRQHTWHKAYGSGLEA